ncbi:MAG: TadE/TadG family type IV pilus assembly protein [Pseudomonadota bacterium]
MCQNNNKARWVSGLRKAILGAKNFLHRENKGVAAIEFAAIVPVFLTLTFGTVNLGHVFYVNHSMQRIASETMRAVTYGELDTLKAKQFAKTQLSNLVGNFVVLIYPAPGGDEFVVRIIAATKASNLIEFPLADASLLRPTMNVALTGKIITRFNPNI